MPDSKDLSISGCSEREAKGTESVARKTGGSTGEPDHYTNIRTRMSLLWSLGMLFAAHMCLGKGVPDKHLNDCSSTGKLSAPQIFLNVSKAQAGDWVSVRCLLSSEFTATMFFFCKDGEYILADKAMPNAIGYTWPLQISGQSAGQYSCGYKLKDNKNQEKKSAVSEPWELTVLSGNHSSNKDLKWILPLVFSAILILAALGYFFVKKGTSQRSSRDQAPVTNRSNLTSEENAQYANIVGLHHAGPPPLRNTETPYAAIGSMKQKPGLLYEHDSQPSWNG